MGGVSGDDGDGIPPSGDLALSDRLRGAGFSSLLRLARGFRRPAPQDGNDDDSTEDADDGEAKADGHFTSSKCGPSVSPFSPILSSPSQFRPQRTFTFSIRAASIKASFISFHPGPSFQS